VKPSADAAVDSFTVGVNYWPARSAMRWWTMFDPAEVLVDFDRIAAAGLDSVRIFLTWEDFQPSPDTVSRRMLDKLVVVADLALDAGLRIMPTLFTGHMSGVNWIPAWATAPGDAAQRFRVVSSNVVSQRVPRSWFEDAEVMAAQRLLVYESATALAGHAALSAWDLGNENSNCVQPADSAAGVHWLESMAEGIRQADAHAIITIGLHMEDLEHDRKIGPAEAAGVCDFLTMHGYPIYAPWSRGPTDEHLLGFLTEVTRWLGDGTDILFSEFGLPTVARDAAPGQATGSILVDETAAADYTDRALHELRRAGATGAMLWCANDYDTAIWGDPPLDEAVHERTFGLWRGDGSPKLSLSAVTRNCGLTIDPPPTDRPWIDIEPGEFFTAGGSHLSRLYQRYCTGLPTKAGDG
jgi:endo-1,4-beta-mannosidase